jgi:putative sterol carrier protein
MILAVHRSNHSRPGRSLSVQITVAAGSRFAGFETFTVLDRGIEENRLPRFHRLHGNTGDDLLSASVTGDIIMDDDQLIAKLRARFDTEAAETVSAVYQFDLDDVDDYHMTIDHGSLDIQPGRHPEPSVTISSDTTTLMKLVRKELNAMQALLTGKVKVKGDIGLASRLPKLFGKSTV